MALLRLSEQPIITYFSNSLLTRLFMLRPMIFLTVNAAIFHEITCALLQFDIINFRFATRCTTHHRVGDRCFYTSAHSLPSYHTDDDVISKLFQQIFAGECLTGSDVIFC
jgi:hypothetical protein